MIVEIDQQRHQRFQTAELNKWLGQVIRKHPPAGLKGRLPKLNYIVQEDSIDLPSFKVFGSYTGLLHWSYKRYMERCFREKWPLAGTPLKFWFINKRA
jgi:GTP-binding protein